MQKPGLFGMNGFLLFLLTCCSFALRAQQPGSLILIDAENKQPFTVRVGDQLYGSSGHGHLVLYHFKDSSYRIYLRIAKKSMAELVFPVIIKQKDLGLQLRGADSSWVLYNWQTKQTIRPVNEPDSSRILEMGIKREDGFSKLMAAVVNDTAVMYNTYTGNWLAKDSAITVTNIPGSGLQSTRNITSNNPHLPAPAGPGGQILQPPPNYADSNLVKGNPAPSNPVPLTPVLAGSTGKKGKISKQKSSDSTIAKKSIPALAGGQPPPSDSQPSTASSQLPNANGIPSTVNGQPSSAIPVIKKLREVNLKISRKMVFLDQGKEGVADTITLFVYFEKGDTVSGKPVSAQAIARKKASTADSLTTGNAQAKTNAGFVFVPGCGEMATDQDLEWLRSAILKANSEQNKITAASSAFALKCFSVSQVRALASLLVSDKARYHLMEAARQHISDKDHFRELANMYTDKNFQKKFLALAEKRS